jgi:hypothetical protein
MAVALSRGALRWIRRLASKRVARVYFRAARVRMPPPALSNRQGVFLCHVFACRSPWQICSAAICFVYRSRQQCNTFARHQGIATAIPRPGAVFLWSSDSARRHAFTTPCQEDHVMAHGTVKWFNDQKGFGFITQEHGPYIFVHDWAIRDTTEYKSLG